MDMDGKPQANVVNPIARLRHDLKGKLDRTFTIGSLKFDRDERVSHRDLGSAKNFARGRSEVPA